MLANWNPQPGDTVRAWSGRPDHAIGQRLTVDRVTPSGAQIVLSDGTRWRSTDLTRIGASSRDWYSITLYRADDPDLLAAEAEQARQSAAHKLEGLGRTWANYQTDENRANLIDAITKLAPYLGLRVTPED